MASVTFKNLRKSYGANVVVKQVDLEIADEEFLVLLGPSGCGKSTVLRMLAGLETITDGQILIGDRVVNDLEPGQRDIAMVFQNYALYPHMTVRQNMAFCLENMRLPRAEIARRVERAGEILNLDELMGRMPSQLSGGQRQRVAIGRAIVREPKVFLMDEPLSNLDAKLRGKMRAEISKIHDQLKITTVYVTHDQVEAMTMGDRIVIISEGVIQQVGPPMEVYQRPNNKFVAGFIGSPTMNFIDVEIADDGGESRLRATGVDVPLSDRARQRLSGLPDRKLVIGFRPQQLTAASADDALFSGRVEVVEPYGPETYINLSLGDVVVASRLEPTDRPIKGEPFHLATETENLYFFDPNTGATIY